MSIREQLNQQLDAINQSDTLHHDPAAITIRSQSDHVLCELSAVGSVGCAVVRLVLESASLAERSLDAVRKTADTLASRLSYLLEPIAVIEIDPEENSVQMRSDPPHREDNVRTYYELLVGARGQLTLQRFRKEPNQPRQVIPAEFTREVLVRLVTDFVTAAGG